MIKLWIFLVVISVLRFISIEGENDIKLKGIRCNISEKYVHKNYTCFAKVYSRTISTLNFRMTFLKPIKKINVLVQLHYKYGVIYREVMHTPMMNWCEVMKDGSQNRMIQQLLSLLKDSTPEMLKKCPLNEITAWNRTVNTQSVIPIYATGDYKMIFLIFDENLERILSLNIIGDMKSSNKDTFG